MPSDRRHRHYFIKDQQGFSLFELLAGIVVLMFLVATLSVGVDRMLKTSKAAHCVSNLHSLGQASLLYAVDNLGYMPMTMYYQDPNVPLSAPLRWFSEVEPYLKTAPDGESTALMRCPSGSAWKKYGTRQVPTSWDSIDYVNMDKIIPSPGANAEKANVNRIEKPSQVAFLLDGCNYEGSEGVYRYNFESLVPGPLRNPKGDLAWRHDGGINVLFCDGHVDRIENPTYDALEAIPKP